MVCIIKLQQKEAEPLTPEESKLFNENLPYALSLTRLYPKIDQGELSSIAYRSLLQALRGYSMKEKERYDPAKASVKTLVNRIFKNEVNRYLKEEGKKYKREPYLEELVAPTDEGEHLSVEEIIPDLKTIKQEDEALWGVMHNNIEQAFSEEDKVIVDKLIDGDTFSVIMKDINEDFHKEEPQSFTRYHRHINQNILPKLEQLFGEQLATPEEELLQPA